MATALDIIRRAMRLFGGIGSGEIVSAEDAQDGRTCLNAMMDSWSVDRLMVYQLIERGPFTLTAGAASYTIGAGGTWNTTRPARIESAYTRDSAGNRHVCQQFEKAVLDGIVTPNTSSPHPVWFRIDGGYPLTTITLYPTPAAANSFVFTAWQTMQSFADLTTVLALPPGYEDMIVYNLAVHFAPEFGLQVPESVVVLAASAKARVQDINLPMPVLAPDLPTGNGNYVIAGGNLSWGS